MLQKQQLPKLEKNIEYILSKNKINKKIHDEEKRKKTHETLYYVAAVALFCLSASYFAVPLYAAFCQMTGFGGTTQRTSDINSLNAYMEKTSHITPDSAPLRPITVRFEGNVHPGMDWEFKPEHKEIQLRIGDTVLTFYKAINRMKVWYFIYILLYNIYIYIFFMLTFSISRHRYLLLVSLRTMYSHPKLACISKRSNVFALMSNVLDQVNHLLFIYIYKSII